MTALGSLDGAPPVLRSGARVGDVVAVAGELGAAGRGLARALRSLPRCRGHAASRSSWASLSAGRSRGSRRAASPRAAGRARSGRRRGGRHGHDGRVRRTRARRVADGRGIRRLHRPRLLLALGDDLASALAGGEDHALLATFPQGSALPAGFRPIGHVVPEGEAAVLVDGRPYAGRGGWDPYHDWDAHSG